jgi:hypothetical protein
MIFERHLSHLKLVKSPKRKKRLEVLNEIHPAVAKRALPTDDAGHRHVIG